MLSGAPAPFGYTGELRSATTGLEYLRARWYNPATGTLLGRDPFAGDPEQPYSLHPYQYGYSQPTRWSDPSGRDAERLGECFAGMAHAYLEDVAPVIPDPKDTLEGASYYRTSAAVECGAVGHVASMVQGAFEIALGLTTAIGGGGAGLAACPVTLGAGCVAGAAAVGAGGVMVVHGGMTFFKGAVGFFAWCERMFSSHDDGGGGAEPDGNGESRPDGYIPPPGEVHKQKLNPSPSEEFMANQ